MIGMWWHVAACQGPCSHVLQESSAKQIQEPVEQAVPKHHHHQISPGTKICEVSNNHGEMHETSRNQKNTISDASSGTTWRVDVQTVFGVVEWSPARSRKMATNLSLWLQLAQISNLRTISNGSNGWSCDTDAKATLKKKLAESTEELQRAQTELSQAQTKPNKTGPDGT